MANISVCISLYFLLIQIFFIAAAHGKVEEKCKHSKEKITAKLLYLINDPIEASQIIHFLTKQEEIYRSYQESPSWTSLCNVYDFDKVFEYTAHLMTKDNEDKINENVDRLYEEFHLVLTNAKDSLPANIKFNDLIVGSALSMDKILQSLSPSVKAKLLKHIPNAYALQTAGANMILHSEVLSAVYLSWEAYYNIYRWWNGEISGYRAAKNIIDSMAYVGGGAVGATAGATVGSFFGPAGTIIGGGIGGVYGSMTAGSFSQSFTEWFFDLPQNEALEKAYRFLGVHHKASNYEINQAFRSLCKRFHPDMPQGSDEKFLELQYYMTIIKVARGEAHK